MSIKHWNLGIHGMVFDPQSGDSFQLNDTARVMLTMLREDIPLEDIAVLLSKKFDVSYENALTDILEFSALLNNLETAQ